VACKRPSKRQSRVAHMHDAVRPREIVPDLQAMLLGIDAYKWFTKTLREDNECCLARTRVPEKMAEGIAYLVARGVLVQDTEDGEGGEAEGVSGPPMLFSATWYAAKVATARVLVCMERVQRMAPQPPCFDETRLGRALSEDEARFLALVRDNPITCLEGAFGTGKVRGKTRTRSQALLVFP
jgi:hypothetical protein